MPPARYHRRIVGPGRVLRAKPTWEEQRKRRDALRGLIELTLRARTERGLCSVRATVIVITRRGRAVIET